MLTTRHPYTGWMIVYLCLWTSCNEASSRFAGLVLNTPLKPELLIYPNP